MKREQSLQHLIVTEMPYELLKLLIEEKALNFFVHNLIVDLENYDAILGKHFNKTKRIIYLMEETPANIILGAFMWSHSVSGKKYEFWSKIYRKALLI